MIRPLSVGVAGVLLAMGTSLGAAAQARSMTTVAPAPQASTTITPTLQADLASLLDAQQPVRIAQAAPAPTTAALEQAVLNKINAYRKSQGLAPLTLDSRITAQARLHSQDMANNRVPFGHQGFDQRLKVIGAAIPWSGSAENVAWNQGAADPVDKAVQGWLNSPGHLRNIRGDFNLTGIGVVRNAQGRIYFTQIFIKQSSQKPVPGPSPTTPPPGASIEVLEKAVFDQINAYRRSQGLAPFLLDSRITAQSRLHSQNMASNKVPFGHDGFSQRTQAIGKVIPWSSTGENVAWNQGYTDPVTAAVQGWLKSPGHLRNIRGDFNLTGIGVAKNAQGRIYFTQIFIKKR